MSDLGFFPRVLERALRGLKLKATKPSPQGLGFRVEGLGFRV